METRATVPPTQAKTPAEVLGARLLKDLEREEGSLESLLKDLRNLHPSPISKTGIPSLDALIPTTSKTTTISGRHLPLLHLLLHHLILTLHGTVCLLDLTSTFSPSHLALQLEELRHIHVFLPTKSSLELTLKSLEAYMLHGEGSRGSRDREWVGTIVLGGFGGDFSFVWRGSWRVQKDAGVGWDEGFEAAVSVEEAAMERRRRIDGASVGSTEERGKAKGKRWKVVGDNGSYTWRDD